MAKKNEWAVVPEGDTDSGKHTCWALEINHERYGKYVWITGVLDHDEETIIRYDVEVIPYSDVKTLAECKTLTSAKRWVTQFLI